MMNGTPRLVTLKVIIAPDTHMGHKLVVVLPNGELLAEVYEASTIPGSAYEQLARAYDAAVEEALIR